MAQVDLKALQTVAAGVSASPAPSKGASQAVGGASQAVKVPVPQQAPQPAHTAPLKPVPIRHAPTSQLLGKIAEQAARTQSGANLYIKRQVFEPTHSVVTRVIDVAKQKVVREVPNLKYLILVTNLLQISGVNVDEKA